MLLEKELKALLEKHFDIELSGDVEVEIEEHSGKCLSETS
jgi:hypothetical protein